MAYAEAKEGFISFLDTGMLFAVLLTATVVIFGLFVHNLIAKLSLTF